MTASSVSLVEKETECVYNRFSDDTEQVPYLCALAESFQKVKENSHRIREVLRELLF